MPNAPAGGITAAAPDDLDAIAHGLVDVATQVESAVAAIDAIPVDAVGAVLGAVGADFVDALLAATRRHRQVVGALAHTTHAAGDLVHQTAALYRATDAAGAAALGAAAGQG